MRVPGIDAPPISNFTLFYQRACYGEITADEAAARNARTALARVTEAVKERAACSPSEVNNR
jgi:hypothetical protein